MYHLVCPFVLRTFHHSRLCHKKKHPLPLSVAYLRTGICPLFIPFSVVEIYRGTALRRDGSRGNHMCEASGLFARWLFPVFYHGRWAIFPCWISQLVGGGRFRGVGRAIKVEWCGGPSSVRRGPRIMTRYHFIDLSDNGSRERERVGPDIVLPLGSDNNRSVLLFVWRVDAFPGLATAAVFTRWRSHDFPSVYPPLSIPDARTTSNTGSGPSRGGVEWKAEGAIVGSYFGGLFHLATRRWKCSFRTLAMEFSCVWLTGM